MAAAELKLAFGAFVALPRGLAAALAFEQTDELFDARTLPQTEKIVLPRAFRTQPAGLSGRSWPDALSIVAKVLAGRPRVPTRRF